MALSTDHAKTELEFVPESGELPAATAVTVAEVAAASALLADGAEFRATRRVLEDWFYKRNLVFAQHGHSRNWIAMQADGRHIEPYEWSSFHEMLAALLERVEAEQAAEQVGTKDVES